MTRREGRLQVILRRQGEVDMSRQRCTKVRLGNENRHSSKSTSAIFDLTTTFDRSFYGEQACNLQEAQKMCFRLVFGRPRSGVKSHFLAWTHNSRVCWKPKSRAIAGSIPSSRTLDCAQDWPSLTLFRPLRPENKVFVGFMVNTHFVVSRMLTCNRILYESFLLWIRLSPPGVTNNLFWTKYHGTKVRHEDDFFTWTLKWTFCLETRRQAIPGEFFR